MSADEIMPGDPRWLDKLDEFANSEVEDEILTIEMLDDPEIKMAINQEPETEADIDEQDEDDILREYESGMLPRYSHDGLAYYLGRKSWDRDAKYVRERSDWFFFDGNRWVVDKKMSAYSQVRTYLRSTVIAMMSEAVGDKAFAAAKRSAESILSSSGVSAVETVARSNPKSAASIEDFDTNLMLIGTPSGTVDLATGELREGRRADMITHTVTIAPAETGSVPKKWLEFLDYALDGKLDVIKFIQRSLGYSLTGSIQEHAVIFMVGEGGSGKGVILNTVAKIFGDYARQSPVETFLKTVSGHPTDLAGLADVRMVVAGETPKGTTWNEATIKSISGGDPVNARFMRGDFFQFIPQMTVWLQGNSRPAFKAVDSGIRRRFILVPFPKLGVQDDDKDTLLVARMIEEEGPEIMRWIIDGAVEWYSVAKTGKLGLAVPKYLRDETRSYLDGEDKSKNFIDDEMIIDPAGFVSNADIYNRWKIWNESAGEERQSQNEVIKGLLDHGRGITKDRKAGCRGLKGVRLLDDQEKYERAAMSDDEETPEPAPVVEETNPPPF